MLLLEAIKSQDAQRELRRLDMRKDVMVDTGVDTIHSIMKRSFGEKKTTNITQAMNTYEGTKRSPEEGVQAFTACFRDAERTMEEASLTTHSGEARGNKYLTSLRLLPNDVRNV